MINQSKKVLKGLGVTSALMLFASGAQAAGLADIATNIDMSDGKAAVTGVAVALRGFLVFGLAARYILGFLKRV